MNEQEIHTGSCLCGKVTYSTHTKLEKVAACHCKQCRVWSGHLWASTACPTDKISITSREDSLVWYASSDQARRGFCKNCGSSLFWQMITNGKEADYYAIAAGSFDEATNLQLGRHIFCKFKGDYYDIPDHEQQDQT